MFISSDATSAYGNEIIWARNYDADLNVTHYMNSYFINQQYANFAFTRQFINTYLMLDGTPFTDRYPDYNSVDFATECTGRDYRLAQTIRGRLTATEQTEPWAWRQVELPIRYYGDESYEIFQMDDTYIPYDTDAPYWHGTDELVLDHLALDRDSYRLIGSEWTSGWVLDEDGRAVRHGVLYAEVWCAKWVSTYEAQTDIPLYRATAVYSLTGDELIVAQYAPLPLAVVVAVASVGVLLLAGLVIVILILLAHRKKKGEEDNAGYNPLDQG